MKVVINKCFGRFRLSDEAELWLKERGVVEPEVNETPSFRSDPRLVECVESLKEKSWGRYAELKVVEIPSGVEWVIEEYDGREWVSEVHRTWG